MNNIGIFYICTGIYKTFFYNFVNSLNYLFKDKDKHLIIISDGLKEFNGSKYGNILINVEEFINFPYPQININKFQIIDYYAEKHNIDIICYFDAETIIIEHDNNIDNFLLQKVNEEKMVSMYSGFFRKESADIHDFMWGTDIMSPFGYSHGKFNDFSMINRTVMDAHNYNWIQTSFFLCKKNILNYFATKIKGLINYNNRILHIPLNFSDEAWINYLYQYTDYDKFYIDIFNKGDDGNTFPNEFFIYKYKCPKEKNDIKYATNYKFEAYILYNENTLENVEKINRFFINHYNNFIINGYGVDSYPISYDEMEFTTNTPIFKKYLVFWDIWFENTNTKLLCSKELYDIIFENDIIYDMNIPCVSDVIAFINTINDETDAFNYNEFYEGEYDYIEGKSFNDIAQTQYVDFVIFSKKYIKSWLNSDSTFIPKIYKSK